MDTEVCKTCKPGEKHMVECIEVCPAIYVYCDGSEERGTESELENEEEDFYIEETTISR